MEDISDHRLTLVALLSIHPGRDADFEEFEGRVTPIMARYGGVIERRIHLGREGDVSSPDQVHIVTFPDDEAFQRYQQDPVIRDLAELRRSIVRETRIWKGVDLELL